MRRSEHGAAIPRGALLSTRPKHSGNALQHSDFRPPACRRVAHRAAAIAGLAPGRVQRLVAQKLNSSCGSCRLHVRNRLRETVGDTPTALRRPPALSPAGAGLGWYAGGQEGTGKRPESARLRVSIRPGSTARASPSGSGGVVRTQVFHAHLATVSTAPPPTDLLERRRGPLQSPRGSASPQGIAI
jgi:hypothetical protein